MIERFKGKDGERVLHAALRDQVLVEHDDAVAKELQAIAELVEIESGQAIIEDGKEDRDLYLILAGRLEVIVKGRVLGERGAGTHVGEMATIDAKARRSAKVRALERCVLARVSEPDFVRIADRAPHVWRALAVELGDRLRQRSAHVRAPNARPRLFVASSAERLAIAEQIQGAMRHVKADVVLWINNVFMPGHGTLEDLLREVDAADFAVVIVHPDDVVLARDELAMAPRDNVLFELGMAMGTLGRERALILRPMIDVKLPSDLLGITTIQYQDGPASTLASRVGPAVTDIKDAVARLGCR